MLGGGGGVSIFFMKNNTFSFMFFGFLFSSRFMLFPTFLVKTKFSRGGGGGQNKIVVLASELVGGRSQVTELPCLKTNPHLMIYFTY